MEASFPSLLLVIVDASVRLIVLNLCCHRDCGLFLHCLLHPLCSWRDVRGGRRANLHVRGPDVCGHCLNLLQQNRMWNQFLRWMLRWSCLFYESPDNQIIYLLLGNHPTQQGDQSLKKSDRIPDKSFLARELAVAYIQGDRTSIVQSVVIAAIVHTMQRNFLYCFHPCQGKVHQVETSIDAVSGLLHTWSLTMLIMLCVAVQSSGCRTFGAKARNLLRPRAEWRVMTIHS